MSAAPGAVRAGVLLTRLRLRQQVNRLVSVYRHRWGLKARHGTGRRPRAGWMIGLWVGLCMVFAIGQISYNSDCCGFSVEFRRVAFGTLNDNQFKFAYTIANIGTFGNLMRRQETVF